MTEPSSHSPGSLLPWASSWFTRKPATTPTLDHPPPPTPNSSSTASTSYDSRSHITDRIAIRHAPTPIKTTTRRVAGDPVWDWDSQQLEELEKQLLALGPAKDIVEERMEVEKLIKEKIKKKEEGRWVTDQTLTYFIAGGLAGATSRTVVSPLERLKIILQVQPKAVKGDTSYTGVWSSLVRMYKEEGFKGFMKGNGVNCARIIPYSAVQFASYESINKALKTYSGQENLNTPLRLTAGAVAGICSVVSTYPLDLVRSRLSIASASLAIKPTAQGGPKLIKQVLDQDLGIWGMTVKVYRTEGGIRGLYRGITATAMGVAPYVSLNFFFYESLKTKFIPTEPDHIADIGLRTLLCGAVAGTVSQTITYPFDVLRRKMQVAGLSALSPQYSGAIDATIKIVKSEGYKGLYRGLWPNLLKVAPSIACSFFTYETVKDMMGTYHRGEFMLHM